MNGKTLEVDDIQEIRFVRFENNLIINLDEENKNQIVVDNFFIGEPTYRK